MGETPAAAGTQERLVTFWISGQRFGAPIGQIKETIVLRPITRVFLMPAWVAGIINLRGDVVAVVDLAAFLGLRRGAGETADSRIVIARAAGRRAGLLVDRLAEVCTIDEAALAPPPPLPSADDAALVSGVVTLEGGAPLVVLDLARLFESDKVRQFQRKA